MSFEGQLFLPSSLTACLSVNWYVCHCCMAVPSPPLSLFLTLSIHLLNVYGEYLYLLCSVNKYFTISAKTLTKALKPELQAKATRRYISEVKVQHIKNGEVVKTVDLTSGKELKL